MYAVIEDSGTQIKVAQGDEIMIDVRELEENQATITFDKVMLVGEGAGSKIGAPYVDGATVEADILEQGRGEKVDVWKFRRRKTYIRHNGHRQNYIKVKVTGING
ncbi:MAG: 50S ribosomal protein L21 [Planctomycetota bacterium]